MKYTTLLLVFAIILTSFTCGKDDLDPPIDCDGVICTLIFNMISVEVKDTNNTPVVLDDFYTVRVSTNDTIRMSSTPIDTGHYVILDDSYQQKLQNQSDDFRFYGVINSSIVVNELYTLSADCCHINKVSGSSIVTLP